MKHFKNPKYSQAPVVRARNPSCLGAGIRRFKVQGQPRQIVHKTHLQNIQGKMDWRCGSSGRVPALQVLNPKFKPQSYHLKKKKGIFVTGGLRESKVKKIFLGLFVHCF
jgi:hypothetical protein